VRTDSEVSTVGALSVLGAGNIYGLRYVMPIAGSSGWYHGLTVGADYKDFDEDVVLEDGLDSAPITYVNWSLAYSASRVTDAATSTLGLTANSGLDGVVNDAAEFAYKRYGATPSYYYLRGSLRHVHSLPWPVRIALRLDGQASIEPLIANEQFAIGGADSVRGYLEAEELGDSGFSGSLELRTVSLVPYVGDRFQDLYALFFYDFALVTLVDALPGQADRADLASLGLGLRVAAFGGLEAALDWAYPVVPGPYTLDGDSRLHFRVLYAF
jgi:hemolysin activation/secretion protein